MVLVSYISGVNFHFTVHKRQCVNVPDFGLYSDGCHTNPEVSGVLKTALTFLSGIDLDRLRGTACYTREDLSNTGAATYTINTVTMVALLLVSTLYIMNS